MNNCEGLKNELRLKINECEKLHKELEKRPFEIKDSCTIVAYPENITKVVNELSKLLDSGKEFYVNANYKDIAVLSLRPIKCDEQIFYGLVVGIQNECNLKINDFVQFQVCDLYN